MIIFPESELPGTFFINLFKNVSIFLKIEINSTCHYKLKEKLIVKKKKKKLG